MKDGIRAGRSRRSDIKHLAFWHTIAVPEVKPVVTSYGVLCVLCGKAFLGGLGVLAVRYLGSLSYACSAASAACMPAIRPNVAPAIMPEPDA